MLYNLPETIKKPYLDLLGASNILHNNYPTLLFTLDGKLVGDIGEAIVNHFCTDFTKSKEGNRQYDFVSPDGINIQVKTTQKDSVGMGNSHFEYEHLIVIRLFQTGQFEIVYDGSGELVYDLYSLTKRNISLSKLRERNKNSTVRLFNYETLNH